MNVLWFFPLFFIFDFLQTSSSTKTTTMTTPAKLFGKNLGEYDEVDVDELLAQLSAEEIKILAKEVDPDVSPIDTIRWCNRELIGSLIFQIN